MKNYLNLIAVSGNRNRETAVKNILNQLGVSFSISGKCVNNIVVSAPNANKKKIIICAHYDSYHSVPGANDNAAACSIILNLIEELKDSDKNIEFVFFDEEESGLLGSIDYVSHLNKEMVEFCINLDMCGIGTNMALTYAKNGIGMNAMFDALVNSADLTFKKLPGGDYDTFVNSNIPSIFIVNSTDDDLNWYRSFENGQMLRIMPDFANTMHQMNDTPEKCNLSEMEIIFNRIFNSLKN